MNLTNFDTAVAELAGTLSILSKLVERAVLLVTRLGKGPDCCPWEDLIVTVSCRRCGKSFGLEQLFGKALWEAKLEPAADPNLLDLLSRCSAVIAACRYCGWETGQALLPGLGVMARDLVVRLQTLIGNPPKPLQFPEATE
ncbi:MAG: hypothetical protein N3E40_00230 [Dehalococcoidia bacterium]|nr:hypothetical protein [Dehalococcoidia bacterium]